MALIELDYTKLPADYHISVAIGPANSVADAKAPTAAELNAMQRIEHALSWNDWDFGIQASETVNEPSFADASNYTEFGAANYGGGFSLFYPGEYHDASNELSLAYDLTKTPGTKLFIAVRIDGNKKNSTPFADGDYIHVFLAETSSETNSIAGSDSLRRTVGLLQQSVFAVYTIVGSKDAIPVPAEATVAVAAGASVRNPVKVLNREFTNACRYKTSDPTKVVVGANNGVITGVAAGTADVTVTNPNTGKEATVAVTVR